MRGFYIATNYDNLKKPQKFPKTATTCDAKLKQLLHTRQGLLVLQGDIFLHSWAIIRDKCLNLEHMRHNCESQELSEKVV